MADQREPLSVEQAGPIGLVTLTRPDELNRFGDALHTALPAALRELASRTEVRVLVLTSTGEAFSAGGDVELMREANRDAAAREATIDQGRYLLQALLDVPKPVIVGVQGPAVGLGATVALTGDLLVASRNAFFSDPHVRVGLVAGDGGCIVWPQSGGMHVAKRFLLTGDRLQAEAAAELGMVTELVDEPEQVPEACHAWAERIAQLPPLAVQGTKRALNQAMKQRMQEVSDLAFAYESQSMASKDHGEAITAFQERRRGIYEGR